MCYVYKGHAILICALFGIVELNMSVEFPN